MSARVSVSKISGSPSRVGHDRVSQAEETRVQTRIQRLALGVEESGAYWANVDHAVTSEERSLTAFTDRWFGAKSLARIRVLVPYLSARYDAFPNALAVLRRWRAMEPDTRRAICHWHLQPSDPMYRRFSGDFLPARREALNASLDRDAVLRWMRGAFTERWGESTLVLFASPRRRPRRPPVVCTVVCMVVCTAPERKKPASGGALTG